MLPGACVQLRLPVPPVDKLRAAGVRDGDRDRSQPGLELLRDAAVQMWLATTHFGMTVEEAWLGVTRHAARRSASTPRHARPRRARRPRDLGLRRARATCPIATARTSSMPCTSRASSSRASRPRVDGAFYQPTPISTDANGCTLLFGVISSSALANAATPAVNDAIASTPAPSGTIHWPCSVASGPATESAIDLIGLAEMKAGVIDADLQLGPPEATAQPARARARRLLEQRPRAAKVRELGARLVVNDALAGAAALDAEARSRRARRHRSSAARSNRSCAAPTRMLIRFSTGVLAVVVPGSSASSACADVAAIASPSPTRIIDRTARS